MESGGSLDRYALAYLDERMWQLEKDMSIGLSGRPADDRSGFDHAYFPALTACCGMLELPANPTRIREARNRGLPGMTGCMRIDSSFLISAPQKFGICMG